MQSRIKQLEKIERIEVDEEDNSSLRLKFVCSSRSGNYPVICEDVGKAYGEHVIFHDANLTINRGDKIAFVGKNGEGKSTLVKCIMDEITDYTGKLTFICDWQSFSVPEDVIVVGIENMENFRLVQRQKYLFEKYEVVMCESEDILLIPKDKMKEFNQMAVYLSR